MAQSAEVSLMRVPPQNVEAEKALLAAVLLDPDALLSVSGTLDSRDFYREAHGRIFQAAADLFAKNEPVDLVTMAHALECRKELEAVGGAAFLARLVENVPMATNAPHYAAIVREKALLRRLIATSSNVINRCYDNPGDIRHLIDEAETSIFRISEQKGTQGFARLSGLLDTVHQTIEARMNHKSLVTGVDTGFNRLNALTAGLQPSDLVILAARPGMGKTALALNIARNAAMTDVSVAVFSLEMSKEQLATRLLCSEGRVDSRKVRGGFIGMEDHRKLVEAAGQIYQAPIHIDDSQAATAMEIRAKCRRLAKEHGLGLIVVDYVQLMKGTRAERRELEISEISRSLKALAKELNVPVLALSQLNRKVEDRTDKRPLLSDLRESGALEQDADVIMFIHRDAAYKKDEDSAAPSAAEVTVAKQRNGPTGRFLLTFLGEYTRFEDHADGPPDW